MSFDLRLDGQRALVTGGTRGVGAAVVRGLHEAGMQVMAAARSMPAYATEGVRYVAADLTTAEGAAELAQSVLQHWGGIDVLVNVFGGSSAPGGGFAALDDVQWSKELDQNLMSAVRLDRALLPAIWLGRSRVSPSAQSEKLAGASNRRASTIAGNSGWW